MQPKIVAVGIDTLKVNVKVLDPDGKPFPRQSVSEQLIARFQGWQEQAQVKKKAVGTDFTFFHARLTMLPNGAPAWQYLLRNDCLEIKAVPRLDLPMIAKVTFQSSFLWGIGSVEDAVQETHAFLKEIFGENIGLQAAQIDMCVDVAGFTMPKDWVRVFVSRARSKKPIGKTEKDSEYFRGRELETLIFSGHGHPVNGKLYNKVAEIKQKSPEKIWFHDIWRMNGWDGEVDVWRHEFSVEREGLHQMRLEDIYETIRNIKRLWAYCTRDWLRMLKPGRDKNWRRWPTADVWKMIQDAFEDYGDKELDKLGDLIRKRIREKNIERGVAQTAGLLTTLGAWDEIEFDPDHCADELFTVIYDKVIERWSKLQIHPHDMIREKKIIYSQVP